MDKPDPFQGIDWETNWMVVMYSQVSYLLVPWASASDQWWRSDTKRNGWTLWTNGIILMLFHYKKKSKAVSQQHYIFTKSLKGLFFFFKLERKNIVSLPKAPLYIFSSGFLSGGILGCMFLGNWWGVQNEIDYNECNCYPMEQEKTRSLLQK